MHAVTVAGHRGASNLNESHTIDDHDVKARSLVDLLFAVGPFGSRSIIVAQQST